MSNPTKTFYEMAHIPCHSTNSASLNSARSEAELLQSGQATLNVDGRVIMGAVSANGQCIPNAKGQIFAANNVPYSIMGQAVFNGAKFAQKNIIGL